jgi:hypothetical protein
LAEKSAGNKQEDDKKRSAVATVGATVWLEAARRSAGVERVKGKLICERVSRAYFKGVAGKDVLPEGLADPKFYRYANGKSSPNENTVKRVEAVWPGTRAAYEIGPFEGAEPVRLWAPFDKPSIDLWDIVCDAFPDMAESLLDGRPHYARIAMMEAAIARLFDEPVGDSPASKALEHYNRQHSLSLKVLAGILAFWRLSLLVYDDSDGRVFRMVAFAVNEPFRPALEQWDAYPALWDAITEVHTVETAKLAQLIGKYALMSLAWRRASTSDTVPGQLEPLSDKAMSGVSDVSGKIDNTIE